jgi:hypothetical protein
MSRSEIVGSNQTTPGAMTAPSTLLTDTTSTTGLLIKQGAGAPATQVPLRVVDSTGSTLFEVTNAGHVASYGMRMGAANGVFTSGVYLNGQGSIPCLQLPDGTSTNGMKFYMGSGLPSGTTVNTGQVGDIYLRVDTPSTVSQRVYICTVAGTPGTWNGIA